MYCPRYSEYHVLYPDSLRLQKALTSFYATVVRFCTRAIQVIERTGKVINTGNILRMPLTSHDVGFAQLVKSFWKPFDNEFGEFEAELRRQNEDVKEEIQLASEQAESQARHLQLIEREAEKKHRIYAALFRDRVDKTSEEARAWRLQVDERESRKLSC
jgi:hypothetical protein